MKSFEFYSPTRVIFGRDCADSIGSVAASYGKKALLVYGRSSIVKSGLYDRIKKSLASAGIDVVDHSGVSANPQLSHTLEGVKLAKEAGVDFIIAAGGGSVIDESKGIAVGACTNDDLWKFYARELVIEKALPVMAVQTLPATSSETNQAAVLTNEKTGDKFSIRSPLIVPAAAFLDPVLTYTIPVQYTAYACFDIMTHLLEGYFTTTESFAPVHDGFVEGMVKAVMKSLEVIIDKPDDFDARASVMWAGALAWNGLCNAGLEGASIPCHIIEHPMSGLYDIAHGAGLAAVVPAFLRYKKDELSGRIIQFGKDVLMMDGEPDCNEVISAYEAWIKKIGCPLSMTELGINNPDINSMTEQAVNLAGQWGASGYTAEDFRAVYKLCL